jgi:hypothetical protein
MAADVIIKPAEKSQERSDHALALIGRKTGSLAAGSYLVAAVLAAGGLAVLTLKLPPLRTKAPAVA